jgi:hypothetical protein
MSKTFKQILLNPGPEYKLGSKSHFIFLAKKSIFLKGKGTGAKRKFPLGQKNLMCKYFSKNKTKRI